MDDTIHLIKLFSNIFKKVISRSVPCNFIFLKSIYKKSVDPAKLVLDLTWERESGF